MNRIAVVEKYPTNYDYNSVFPFTFKKLALMNTRQDKVLKRDITLDMDKVKEEYDTIIVVGKEPSKFIAGITSVTDMQGYLVDDKYLAMLNPLAVNMRPSLENAFNKSINDIIKSITGEESHIKKDYDVEGIQCTKSIMNHLNLLLDKITKKEITCVAMDTETSALYPRDGYVMGISMSYKKEQGVYLDSMYIDSKCLELIQEICNTTKIVFHNAKFDIKMLKYHFDLNFPDWEDTMLEHYVLDETEGSHGLKSLAIKHTKLGDYDEALDTFKREFCTKHKIRLKDFTYDLIPFDIMYPYASLDTAATIELHSKFSLGIKANPKLELVYNRLLKEGTKFLIDVEENGIPMNPELAKVFIEDINKEIHELTEKLYTFDEVKVVEEAKKTVFNVNSPAQKAYLFFDVLGLPVQKLTATGNPSTDAETINALADMSPIPRVVNDIMKLKKIKSTYLEKFLVGMDMDNRLRTGFNLHTTTSGRLSSSGKLNAQQLPRKDKRPKKCIEAREGFKVVSQDLGTAEMYIAAVLSGDKALQQIFIDGVDYHGAMAVEKFGLTCHPNEVATLFPDKRQEAKTISFEILYKLNYNEPALEGFPQLKKWLKTMEKQIKRDGFIYSHFGRKRRLEDVFSPDRKEAQHMVRSGINFLVQSVASDVNLLAGIDMQNWIIENGYQNEMLIFGLVHDSILAEVDDNLLDIYVNKLKEFTEMNRAGMIIPGKPIGIDVEIGQNYADVKTYGK